MIIEARIFDIRQMGADSTGNKPSTSIINKCIQQASEEGGGTIYIPSGTYLTGPIIMQSNITIDIESGALLKFSDKFEDYMPFVQLRWEGTVMQSFSPLFYANNANNLTIKGRGTIDGQGAKWWKEDKRLNKEIKENNGKNPSLNNFQQKWIEANRGLTVSPYYEASLMRKFFRPPFIQFFQCQNIQIKGITIINSPYWTVNPEMCDNITIDGITIINDPESPNTDGINPSSCSNVRIANCHINVGDDCITIKSGRDADGRKWGKPCENITITNCTMLAGHGGVVIGSEMSGGIKKIAISNCVFNGTDAGIRLKASRGRGGVVEEIRVDNIIMNDIQGNAFIFDLFYDKHSVVEPVSERTPVFRNIHISNVTGNNINQIGYITGIDEMPIDEISFNNINISAKIGFKATTANNLSFSNIDWSVKKGASLTLMNCNNVLINDFRSKIPIKNQEIISINNSKGIFINNCYTKPQTDIFSESHDSEIIWGHNFLNNTQIKQH